MVYGTTIYNQFLFTLSFSNGQVLLVDLENLLVNCNVNFEVVINADTKMELVNEFKAVFRKQQYDIASRKIKGLWNYELFQVGQIELMTN